MAAPSSSASGKDTVYIDVDDEITNVIDKVKNSPHKIVALVLPKRATVLQSVVNMKLLKRSAAAHKKSIVLITSEAGLMPLAGVAGLHVAKSLQTKPEIPPLPDRPLDDDAEITVDDADAHESAPLDKTASVGTLAAAAAVAAKAGDDADESEVIELDNVNPEESPSLKETAKSIKQKHLKVPNFDKFRVGTMIAIGAGIFLIIFWFFAAIVWPHATVTITTDTSTVDTSVDFTASTTQKTLDVGGKKVNASYKELKKTDTQKVPATGQKDNGTKASGTIKIYNCSKDDKLADITRTVPAGTGVSVSGLTFITAEAGSVEPSSYSGNNCQKNKSVTVNVTAQSAGDKYNIAAKSGYAISGFETMTGDGSAMTGGTSSIVKVVSQSDLDGAAETMKGRLDNSAYTSIKAQFQKDTLMAIDVSKVAGNQTITSSPALGEEAPGDVTVTAVTTYSMLGVNKDDISQLVKKETGNKIDTKKQAITNDGLSSATFTLTSFADDNKTASLNVTSTVTAGPEINQDNIKNLAKGKKKGEIEKELSALPGVVDVEVKYSPFWVLSTPKAAKKINVVVKKSTDGQTINSTSSGL